jgi:hypothetical protein
LKSFQWKGERQTPPDDPGNPTVDFHGEKRSNETHESTTDPDARLARKGSGKEAKLSYNGNLVVENRNGIIMDTETWEATGTAERDAALAMLERIPGTDRVTVGADKAYDTKGFVEECRNLNVTPHLAQPAKPAGCSSTMLRRSRALPFATKNGASAEKHMFETFGSGVGVIDFDNDGQPTCFSPTEPTWPTASHRLAIRSIAIWATENSRM